MHPILFRIPMPGWELPLVGKLDSIPIYSYGVMLGLSLVVGWYLTLGLAKADGLPREQMANNYVITAIAAVVASRLLYVVTNLHEFETFGDLFSMRRGGLVAYGGFIGGFIGSYAYLKLKRLPLLPWADVAVPSLASGTAITRIGCYLFGCDYGQPLSAEAPAWLQRLGRFPHWEEGLVPAGAGAPAWVEHVRTRGLDPEATHSLPVHPTQLYEVLVGAALLVLLLWVRRRQRFRGQIFFLWAFTYGALRFVLEIWRDDPERGNVPPSLPEHILLTISLTLFAIGFAVGLSRIIEREALRRVAQALAFVPAIVAFVLLRPGTFAGAPPLMLSTSQFIGLASALAVSVGYLILDRAAIEHPETAMVIELPEEPAKSDDDDDEDYEEDDEPRPRKAKRAAADDASPAAKKRSKASKVRLKKKVRDPDESSDEPSEGEPEGEEKAVGDDAEAANEPESARKPAAENDTSSDQDGELSPPAAAAGAAKASGAKSPRKRRKRA
jgi:phosphatidylglycerol:prolipoprotein diacylglycerol transferase